MLGINNCLFLFKQHFQLPIVYSSSGLELIGGGFTTIFILDEFEKNVKDEPSKKKCKDEFFEKKVKDESSESEKYTEVFTCLLKAGQRILGPTAVMQYANKGEVS